MQGVIYARYSSDNQREESIEGQIRENMEYAKKNGIDIIETYIDRAYSAKTDNRPEFQRMIRESAKKNYDVVIVWKLDRFARNRYDSAKYKSILKKNNKKVVSATEAISEGAEGIILESLLEGMAEYYSAELAEKVSRGMMENALKCKYNGSTVPYGYSIDRDHHYQLDPITAPIAYEIFKRYADGEPAINIVNDLNSRGLRTSVGRLFNKNSIRHMLNNRNYIGEYHYKDIIVPNGVPAIVPVEIFDKAAKRLEKNKRVSAKNKAKEKYLLTTKLFCGKCGSMMIGESANKKNGTYRYYKCASVKRHECDKKSVRKEFIEDFAVRKAVESISDDTTLNDLAKQILHLVKEDNIVIPALDAQLKTVKSAINNIMNAIEQGIFTKTTKERLEELEAEEERLNHDIENEKKNQITFTEEQILFFLYRFRALDTHIEADREKLIDGLIDKIILYDDGKIIITYNYQNEPVETTVEEIENAAQLGSDIDGFAPPQKKPDLSTRQIRFL